MLSYMLIIRYVYDPFIFLDFKEVEFFDRFLKNSQI